MQMRSPQHWQEYELIDSGDFEKLERFGAYTLIRPEPQALWGKNLSSEEWLHAAHSRFVRDTSKAKNDIGGWTHYKKVSDHWSMSYTYKTLKLKMKLAFTSFGHIGVFPEQSDNWDFIFEATQGRKSSGAVLNLFAYTGGASLAARAAGYDVTHVDAVKNMITWARDNQQLSELEGIRWVVEDALKFVKREVTRGKTYQGIILDPPAYGRGPAGEKWVLEEGLPKLLEHCSHLLASKHSFFILNLYSMGLSSLVAANLATSFFAPEHMEFGEFYIPSRSGQQLPLGTFLRFTRASA